KNGTLASMQCTAGCTHVKAGRDYINNGTTPKPGYAAYVYPHPLSNAPAPTLEPPADVDVEEPADGDSGSSGSGSSGSDTSGSGTSGSGTSGSGTSGSGTSGSGTSGDQVADSGSGSKSKHSGTKRKWHRWWRF